MSEDDATSDEREGYDVCYCGCSRAEHQDSGRCAYCDCDKFNLDEEATILAAVDDRDMP